MKALILDGSLENDSILSMAYESLKNEMKDKGWEFERVVLRDEKIHPCTGCGSCWVRPPGGECVIDDMGKVITKKYVKSELVVFLTPVTFGGYSHFLKRAVDRLIPMVMPFFEIVDGEVHHSHRYEKYPGVFCIGSMPEKNPGREQIFRRVFGRNTINFMAEKNALRVFSEDDGDEKISKEVIEGLNSFVEKRSSEKTAEESETLLNVDSSVLLLIGSSKPKESSSDAIGSFILKELEEKGFTTEKRVIPKALLKVEKTAEMLDLIDKSDVIIYCGPLYVDAIPSEVVKGLGIICEDRNKRPAGPVKDFLAISQCGFPEAFQNNAALEILREFATESCFRWIGGLASGMASPLGAASLEKFPPAAKKVKALKMCAEAIAQNTPIPERAFDLFAEQMMPNWLYTTMGTISFKAEIRRNRGK